jgi:isoleucyl-tRNA synthetase
LISNLYDFDPEHDCVSPPDLDELDRWILHRTESLLSRCREAYEKYEFHTVFHGLNNYCSVDLSAQYLDIVKDRLYCAGAKSNERRAAQTTLHRILNVLVHLLAPILSFTAEEIWTYMGGKDRPSGSIFLSQMPKADPAMLDRELADRWDRIFKERAEVLKALEEARTKGIIGHSLDAKVVFVNQNGGPNSTLENLIKADKSKMQDVLIVSQADISESMTSDSVSLSCYKTELLNCQIAVSKAEGLKCERCWKYDTEVGKDASHPTVCARCAAVLNSGAAA